MIINSAQSSALAIAADNAIAEIGDDNTHIPPVILPVEKLLAPHHILASGTGKTATTSIITSFEKLRAASTGGSADVLFILTRGLWTIRWNIMADFQSGGTANQTAAVELLVQMEADTQNIAAIFRASAPQFQSGFFRLLLGADASIRLDIVATGVSDAIDVHTCLNVEKNIG